MNNNLNFFAKILLKEYFKTFESLLFEFENSDRIRFASLNKKILRKSDYDIDDIDQISLFIIYSREIKKLYSVDWCGEEYSGQITKSIKTMLKNYDQELIFNWNHKAFTSGFINEIKRGEYVPLLFSEMDKVLSKIGYRIVLFCDYSDTYSYCILPAEDVQEVINISDDDFAIIDTKVYAIYLLRTEEKNSKVLIYLKNKFNISLREIRDFSLQDRILLNKGNFLAITEEKKKLEKIGARWVIEKIS